MGPLVPALVACLLTRSAIPARAEKKDSGKAVQEKLDGSGPTDYEKSVEEAAAKSGYKFKNFHEKTLFDMCRNRGRSDACAAAKKLYGSDFSKKKGGGGKTQGGNTQGGNTRGGAGAPDGGDDSAAAEEQAVEVQEGQVADPSAASGSERSEKAIKRAQAMGQSLNAVPTDDLADPGSATAGGGLAGGRPVGAGRVPDPANPGDRQELLLASVSGFGGSFDALGLQVGAGSRGEAAILRRDGTPASDGEVEALRRHIASEPTALLRRPDFFSRIGREEFSELKEDYRARPELRETEFKDMGLSESERDILYTQSCQRLSGQCNPHASQPAYQKGQDVPPEDLKKIWNRLHASRDEEDEEQAWESDAEEEAAAAGARSRTGAPAGPGKVRGIYGRINSVIRGIRLLFSDGAASGGADVSAPPVRFNDLAGGPRRAIMVGEPRRRAAFSSAPRAAGAPGRPAGPAGAAPSGRPWAAAAAAGLALAGAWWLGRRRSARVEKTDGPDAPV